MKKSILAAVILAAVGVTGAQADEYVGVGLGVGGGSAHGTGAAMQVSVGSTTALNKQTNNGFVYGGELALQVLNGQAVPNVGAVFGWKSEEFKTTWFSKVGANLIANGKNRGGTVGVGAAVDGTAYGLGKGTQIRADFIHSTHINGEVANGWVIGFQRPL